MKQAFGIMIAVVYILLIIGVPISVHHCESMQEISVSIDNDASSCCSSTSLEEKSCQSQSTNENKINNCCSIEMQKDDNCCTTKEQIVKLDSDQQLTSKHKVSFELNQFALLSISNNICFENFKPKVNTVFLDLPPPQTKSTQILQHQFTFYG